VSWPKSIPPDKRPRSQFHHVNDIVPTIYDILGIKAPTIVDGVTQDPMDGVSMVTAFHSADAPDSKHTQYFEIMGSRAIYRDGLIASVFGPRVPWQPGIDPAIFQWRPDKDTWELYDLRSDFSQADDLAEDQPEKVAQMVDLFLAEAKANKAFPIGGGLAVGGSAPGVRPAESGHRVPLHGRCDRSPGSHRAQARPAQQSRHG